MLSYRGLAKGQTKGALTVAKMNEIRKQTRFILNLPEGEICGSPTKRKGKTSK